MLLVVILGGVCFFDSMLLYEKRAHRLVSIRSDAVLLFYLDCLDK